MSEPGSDLVHPSAPAGWYDDERGWQRYWDGSAWTDHYMSFSGEVVPFAHLESKVAGWYPDKQGVTRWWSGTKWTEHVQEKTPSQRADFAGIAVIDHWIYYQGQGQAVAGVNVLVETAGQLAARSTVTRTVAGGLLFGPAGLIVGALFRKKQDMRELYLLVDGPLYAWAVPVPPKLGPQARNFAAFVITLSKHFTAHPPA